MWWLRGSRFGENPLRQRGSTYVLAAELPRHDSLGLQPEDCNHIKTEAPKERRYHKPIMRRQIVTSNARWNSAR
jgi:hypothetical protein